MRIAVFGTGGVGGYFGGRLAQAGEDVVFIARGEHLKALQMHGLRVDSTKGDFIIHPAKANCNPAEIGAVDVVLITVKAWQVPEVTKDIRPLIRPETVIVPLQNGVEALAQLAEVFGNKRVIGGSCSIISFINGPGHIRNTGGDPFIQFGELDNISSERVEKLRRTFALTSGLRVEVPPDIQIALWKKFLFIVSWGGVGAVTRSPIGVFRSLPQTRQMLQRVMQEIFNVAMAHDIALPPDTVSKTLSVMDGFSPNSTASMQRDIMSGRPSELEAQNGAVVRFGQKVGVDTPLNTFIYHSLLPMELKARGRLDKQRS